MRNRMLPVWSCVVAALFAGQMALADKGKPGKKATRPQEAGGVAAVAEAAGRLSSSLPASPRSEDVAPVEVSVAGGGNNDSCSGPQAISGTGQFVFDNSAATMDGPAHAACNIFGQSQIDHDVWFCWTAPAQVCDGTYSVSTCGRTEVDTRIAVYNGCGCPTEATDPIDCRDDQCETQTRLTFDAVPGQQYMIRLGTFPGASGPDGPGTGSILISCDLDPPCDEPASHCQQQDQTDALNSNRSGFVTADGFTPTQSGNVNSVCWWGAYLNNLNQNCESTSTDTFRIRYFNDLNGLPNGLPIASYSQQSGTLIMEPPFATGLLINGVAVEYEFHATHPDVPVVAGNCYWIEITNELTGCTWFWEVGVGGDGRAVQDGKEGPPAVPPNGYDISDVIVGDLAFCINLDIEQEGDSCLPPPPANDNCANATVISGPGTFNVDTAAATSVGPDHQACLAEGETGIDRDVWYRWTSTCSGDVVVRTCNTSAIDTKMAVYSGTICPTIANNPVSCNDDLCGPDGFQSMLVFTAAVDQQFLIRVGSYPEAPGGVIGIVISCGAPDNASCGAGSANSSCCVGGSANSPGCAEESCCELVCACDPFCCDVEWDIDCATNGLADSGCGAADLCGCDQICGNPNGGSCCSAQPVPGGCSDEACCEAVCACDSFCCDTEWDANCAGTGFVPGCGAQVLCADLCSAPPSCPAGTIAFVNPPHLAVDARRPHLPGNPAVREGFQVFTATGPSGAQASCWSVQETATFGSPNTITSVLEAPAGTYTITLSRPITAGAGTSITYTPSVGSTSLGCFKSHPANVNSDSAAAPADIIQLIDHLNGVRVPPLAIWQCDIDRSTLCLPADIIAEIDLLNGSNGFIVWNGTARPTGPAGCP